MFKFLDKLKGSSDRKSAQNAIKILAFAGLFAIVIFAVKSTDNKPKEQNIGNFDITREDRTLKAKWVSQAASDLKSQQDSINALEKRINDMQTENKVLAEKVKKYEELPTQTKNESDSSSLYKKFPLPSDESREELNKYVPQGLKDLGGLISEASTEKNTKEKSSDARKILETTPIIERQVYQQSLAVESVPQKEKPAEKKQRSFNDLLPTGSIIRAKLVNGMDAPTMSQAKDNPLITHMLITDLAILPNKYKYDVRQCFVLGEGYGDLSSERVYIRTNNLSCITEDGEHIDFDLKGYVAGEDGKIGLRGEVVSKQGAVIARAIVAGFVDGVGKAFSQVGNSVQVTPFGTTTTNSDISSSELAKKGAYSGLSAGASRLADFYLKLADQVFPIIEIAAGREVDIVISSKREMITLEEEEARAQAANSEESKATKDGEK